MLIAWVGHSSDKKIMRLRERQNGVQSFKNRKLTCGRQCNKHTRNPASINLQWHIRAAFIFHVRRAQPEQSVFIWYKYLRTCQKKKNFFNSIAFICI